MGEPFKNIFAQVIQGQPEVTERPYGPDIIVEAEPINAAYAKPNFRVEGKIAMQQSTLNFLEVICGSSSYTLMVLRVFIRNIITARYEGRNWQSAVYLYGAPGTSKSVWSDLIKGLVSPNAIQEFNRHQNQFYVGQLAECQVLVVSDLTQITPKQIEVLKRVLGRDTLTHEKKYESEFGVIAPYCQVLIISNHPPSHFWLFNSDQAVMDKLIKVYLGPQYQIPSKFQIANLGTRIDKYLPDIFNWAMFCKHTLLKYFIRAVDLNALFDSEMGGQDLRGIPAFIQSCVYKTKQIQIVLYHQRI